MQSVIVYRNPLEAMFWESVFTRQFWVVILAAVVAVSVVVYIEGKLTPLGYKYKFIRKWHNWLVFMPAVLSALVVLYFLF